MGDYQTSEMDILLSPEALEVWKMLDETQKRTIQKEFPLKAKRNREIIRLRQDGVPVKLLMELAGLGKVAVINITRGVKTGSAVTNDHGGHAFESSDTGEIIRLLREIKAAILSKQ